MSKTYRFLLLVLMALLASTGVSAHHNYVSHYDMDTPKVTITGTVKSFWFVNPHIRIYIDRVNETTGENEIWIVEGRSRSILAREGWVGDEVQQGDTITLGGTPARTASMKTHMLMEGPMLVNDKQLYAGPLEKKIDDYELGGEGASTAGSHLDARESDSGAIDDSAAVKRPNIVLLISDDQAWYGTSVQMHPDMPNSKSDFYHTPRLEELASQGMRFSSGYAPATVCAPTRASLQTGMSPAKNLWTKAAPVLTAEQNLSMLPQVHRRSLHEDEVTIGEVLSAAGYSTAHYGKWHIDGGGPEANGYDESDGNTSNQNAQPFNKSDNPLDVKGMSNRALDFMRRADEEGKPSFVQLSYYPLHVEKHASAETIDRVESRAKGALHDNVLVAAITEDLDTGVGVIMDGLEKLGLDDNTYVIYMGDNGHRNKDNPITSNTAATNAPLLGAKGNVSEGGIRVPFIIRGPGVEANSWSDVPVVGYDFFPTFAEWAVIEKEKLPQGIEGGSLVSLLENNGVGAVKRQNEGLVFHFPHYQDGEPQSALRLGNYKLIKYYEGDKVVLIDLSKDIGERNNLAEKIPIMAAQLEKRLDQYLTSVNAQLPTVNPDFDPAKDSVFIRGGGVGPVPYNPQDYPRHIYFPDLGPRLYPTASR